MKKPLVAVATTFVCLVGAHYSDGQHSPQSAFPGPTAAYGNEHQVIPTGPQPSLQDASFANALDGGHWSYPPATSDEGQGTLVAPGCVDFSHSSIYLNRQNGCHPLSTYSGPCGIGQFDPCLDHGVCGLTARAPSRWFGAAFGLVMTRNRDKDIFVGYDDADPMTQRLTTRDAAMEYAGGVETHLGRHLNNQWAVEAVYWGIYPSEQIAQLFADDVVGNVDSPFEFNYLEYDNGTGPAAAGSYFDDTQLLRVIRSYEYHNVELNFLRCPLTFQTRACRPVCVGLLAGVRYLQLNENFDLDSDVANNAFGDDLDNELFYDMNVDNHLVGFQIGGQLEYCLTSRMSLQTGTKLGIYGNHMRHQQSLWGGNGSALISTTSPLGYAGSAYSSDTSKDDVAFVGELLVGFNYCLTPRWSLAGGYRAVSVSGVALPTGQIPIRFDDLASVDNINSNDSLVLHGGYAGLIFNW